MFLQSYWDDSCIGQSPLYCLAGIVGPAGYWERFSSAWQNVLNMEPAVSFWKTSAAVGGYGEFGDWGRDELRKRVGLLMQLLNDPNLAKFAVTCRHDAYMKVHGNNKAYTLLFPLAITETADIMAGFGYSEPVDWIFDDQPEHMREVADVWQWFYDSAPDTYRKTLKNAPIFRDEKEYLPIQAADLFAWVIRRELCAKHFGMADAPDVPDLDWRSVAHSHLSYEEMVDRKREGTMRAVAHELAMRLKAKNGEAS